MGQQDWQDHSVRTVNFDQTLNMWHDISVMSKDLVELMENYCTWERRILIIIANSYSAKFLAVNPFFHYSTMVFYFFLKNHQQCEFYFRRVSVNLNHHQNQMTEPYASTNHHGCWNVFAQEAINVVAQKVTAIAIEQNHV